jgi:hypothetical protein
MARFGEHALGDRESGIRRWESAVDTAVQDYLRDLLGGHPVSKRRSQMHLQLLRAIKRDQSARGSRPDDRNLRSRGHLAIATSL